MKKRRLRMAGFALVIGMLLPLTRHSFQDVIPAETVQAAAADEGFKRVWTVPVPGFRSAALSPDGHEIAVLFDTSPDIPHTKISFWHWTTRPAAPLWTQSEPGMSQLTVSREGQYVLAWAKMNPRQHNVSLRRGSDGARLLSKATRGLLNTDGAIWDTQVSPDGRFAAITTGVNTLYLLTMEDAPKLHRWSLPGVGNSVTFGLQGASLTAATWDESGVSCYTASGAPLWRFPAQSEPSASVAGHIFEAQTSGNGRSILGVSYNNVGRADAGLYLWKQNGTGVPIWHYQLNTEAYRPSALITSDGRYAVVGYSRLISRGEQSIPELRLAYLDIQQNKLLWEQGNLLFSPHLIALSPSGERITVSDGQRLLYNLNALGRVTVSYALRTNGTIRQVTATPNGRYVLIYTSDGMLSLIQIGADTN